jgi:hypothetical protein
VLDPYGSCIRWAATRARQHIKGFILGGVVFSVVAASVSSIVREPPHPTALDHVSNATVGVLAALALICLLAFSYAFIVAPYEQRKRLREELTAAKEEIHDLKSTRIHVEFDQPEIRHDPLRVLIRFTNQGKPSDFIVRASNVKGQSQSLPYFDPFPVSWDGSGTERRRLHEGESHNLHLCSMMATSFGKHSRTFELSFMTPTSHRDMQPCGTITVDLEAEDQTTMEIQRARVTLDFSKQHDNWFEFKGAQCVALT